MAKTKSKVGGSDTKGYKSLVSGIYSSKTPSNPARITSSTGDMTGRNNPQGYKGGLLGKKTGYGTGKNKLADNPLGIKDGLLGGKGLGVKAPKPNFSNNPIGYVGGLLINRKRGK